MFRTGLWALAAYYGVTGVYIFLAPMLFYQETPGVAEMGPFNLHFIRDVALAFLASAAAMAWGLRKRLYALCLAGSFWVALHALFHVQIQIMRGLPLDLVLASDFFGVIVPGCLSVWFSLKLLRSTT